MEDKQKLSELELIRRVQHAVTQSPDKWNNEMQEAINQVFEKYDDLKTAYQISQDFKKWYDYSNRFQLFQSWNDYGKSRKVEWHDSTFCDQ